MKYDLSTRRRKRSSHLPKKTQIKFENLRLLEYHAELMIQRYLKQQINLLLLNKQLHNALDQILKEEDNLPPST